MLPLRRHHRSSNSSSVAHQMSSSEPANCVAWAKQGLCDTGAHVEYMSQNCAATCANVDAGSSGRCGRARRVSMRPVGHARALR